MKHPPYHDFAVMSPETALLLMQRMGHPWAATAAEAAAGSPQGELVRNAVAQWQHQHQQQQLLLQQQQQDPLMPTRAGPNGVARRAQATFPRLLHALLDRAEADGYSHICSWQAHGRAFRIHNKQAFEETLLPERFASQAQYASFQRQLNLYGFMRLNRLHEDQGAYYHACFLRGRPDLTVYIHRLRVRGNRVRQTIDLQSEPDLRRYPPLPPVVLSDSNPEGGGGGISSPSTTITSGPHDSTSHAAPHNNFNHLNNSNSNNNNNNNGSLNALTLAAATMAPLPLSLSAPSSGASTHHNSSVSSSDALPMTAPSSTAQGAVPNTAESMGNRPAQVPSASTTIMSADAVRSSTAAAPVTSSVGEDHPPNNPTSQHNFKTDNIHRTTEANHKPSTALASLPAPWTAAPSLSSNPTASTLASLAPLLHQASAAAGSTPGAAAGLSGLSLLSVLLQQTTGAPNNNSSGNHNGTGGQGLLGADMMNNNNSNNNNNNDSSNALLALIMAAAGGAAPVLSNLSNPSNTNSTNVNSLLEQQFVQLLQQQVQRQQQEQLRQQQQQQLLLLLQQLQAPPPPQQQPPPPTPASLATDPNLQLLAMLLSSSSSTSGAKAAPAPSETNNFSSSSSSSFPSNSNTP